MTCGHGRGAGAANTHVAAHAGTLARRVAELHPPSPPREKANAQNSAGRGGSVGVMMVAVDMPQLNAEYQLAGAATDSRDSRVSGTDSRDTCYICFDSEGCMLVNVCKCRSRVHQSCLSTMVKHNGCSVCTVCKSGLEYPCEPPLLELLNRTYPCAMLVYAIFSLLVGFATVCIVVWSSIYMRQNASSSTTILCVLVLGYSMINTIVILHHRKSRNDVPCTTGEPLSGGEGRHMPP